MVRSPDPCTWGSEAGAHHGLPGPAHICSVRPLCPQLGVRVGDPGCDPVAERGCGDIQETRLPLAGQLIKFLQEPLNSLALCPPPQITHLPGKGLRSGLLSPSISLFLIRQPRYWLVMRGSERSVPWWGGRVQAGSGPHPEMSLESSQQDGDQQRGSRQALVAVSLAQVASGWQSSGTALSWEE